MKIKELLSPCEYAVLERMVLGESMKEIAEHTYRVRRRAKRQYEVDVITITSNISL